MPRDLTIKFPLGGVSQREGFSDQPRGTTPLSLNMTPAFLARSSFALWNANTGRRRGSRRPGLAKAFSTQLGSGAPVDMIANVAGTVFAASNGSGYYSSGGSTLSTASGGAVLPTGYAFTAADLGTKLFIGTVSGASKATASNGAITDGRLDSASIADWSALSISSVYDVVQITSLTRTGGIAYAGTYTISDINSSSGLLLGGLGAGDSASSAVFTVVRGPAVYNSATNALAPWVESSYSDGTHKGFVPLNCPIIARHRGRIFAAGDGTPTIYASRQNDAYDWDTGADPNDPARAFATTAEEAGVIGEEPTALIPYTDDYMLIATRTSMWVLRGDPLTGGVIDNVSRSIGCVHRTAWCHGPQGEIYFLSTDGIYMIAPQVQSLPVRISDALPGLWRNMTVTDGSGDLPSMAYDPDNRGIWMHVTNSLSGNATSPAVFIDENDRSLWPVQIPAAMNIYSSRLGHNSHTQFACFGCKDGYIRRYSPSTSQTTDDGTAISAYILLGPVPLSADRALEGLLETITVTLSVGDSVSWRAFVGKSAEEAVTRAANYHVNSTGAPPMSGTFIEDTKLVVASPRLRGVWAVVTLASTSAFFELEEMVLGIRPAGRWRP